MSIFGESKVGNKFQTIIPQAVREKAGISPEDVMVWEVSDDEDSTIILRVRKSRKEQLRRLNVIAFPDDDEE